MPNSITQKCNVCQGVKPLAGFVKRKTEKNGYRKVCKTCHSIKQEEYKRKDPDRIRDQKLRYTLGISLAQKRIIMKKQSNCCDICKVDLDTVKFTPVDHDHKTGKIRGVLCGSCNVGLGHFRDSLLNLFFAAWYLIKHRFYHGKE